MATVATDDQGKLIHTLMRPWRELPDHVTGPTARPKGFWGLLGQFVFDYNRY